VECQGSDIEVLLRRLREGVISFDEYIAQAPKCAGENCDKTLWDTKSAYCDFCAVLVGDDLDMDRAVQAVMAQVEIPQDVQNFLANIGHDDVVEPQMHAVNGIRAMYDTFSDPALVGRVRSVATSVSEHAVEVNIFVRAISETVKFCQAAFDWVKDHKLYFIALVMLALASVNVVRRLTTALLDVVISGALAIVKVTNEILYDALTEVRDFIRLTNQKDDVKTPESIIETQGESIGGAATLIAFALASFVKPTTSNRISVAMKHATAIAAGLTLGSKALLSVAEVFPERLRDFLIDVGFYRPFSALKKSFQADCARAHDMCTRVERDEAVFANPVNATEFLALYERLTIEGPTHMVTLPNSAPERFVHKHLIDRMAKLRDRALEAAKSKNRPRPIGVFLSGKRGIGKSVIMSSLASAVSPHLAPTDRVYFWNPFLDHVDGWHGQEVWAVDDWGASDTDIDIRVADMLRLMSNNPWYPRCASLESKGRSAAPKMVCLSSNYHMENSEGWGGSSLKPDTVQAFNRRFLNLHVELVHAFAKPDGTLNIERLNALPPEEKARFPHLQFWQFEVRRRRQNEDKDRWERNREPMTFEQLLGVVRAQLQLAALEVRNIDQANQVIDAVARAQAPAHEDFINLYGRHENDVAAVLGPDLQVEPQGPHPSKVDDCPWCKDWIVPGVKKGAQITVNTFNWFKIPGVLQVFPNGIDQTRGYHHNRSLNRLAWKTVHVANACKDFSEKELYSPYADKWVPSTFVEFTEYLRERGKPEPKLEGFWAERAEKERKKRRPVAAEATAGHDPAGEDILYVPLGPIPGCKPAIHSHTFACDCEWCSEWLVPDVEKGRLISSKNFDWSKVESPNPKVVARKYAAMYKVCEPELWTPDKFPQFTAFLYSNYLASRKAAEKEVLEEKQEDDDDSVVEEEVSVVGSEREPALRPEDEPLEEVDEPREPIEDILLPPERQLVPDWCYAAWQRIYRVYAHMRARLQLPEVNLAEIGEGRNQNWLVERGRRVADRISRLDWSQIAKISVALASIGGLVAMFAGSRDDGEDENIDPQVHDYQHTDRRRRGGRAGGRVRQHKVNHYSGVYRENWAPSGWGFGKHDVVEPNAAIETALYAGYMGDELDAAYRQSGTIMRAIRNASCRVSKNLGDGTRYAMYGCVSGRSLICNKHFFMAPGSAGYMDEETPFHVEFGDANLSMQFCAKNLQSLDVPGVEKGYQSDVVAYDLGRVHSKSIRHHFADCMDTDKWEAFFFVNKDDVLPLDWTKVVETPIRWSPSGVQTQVFSAGQYLTYSAKRFGDCGSLVVGVRRGEVKIIAIHAARLTRKESGEQVSIALPFSLDEIDAQGIITASRSEESEVLPPDFNYIGVVDREPGRAPPISKFVRLKIGFRTEKQPALLGARSDTRSTLSSTQLIFKEMARSAGKRFEMPEKLLSGFEDYFCSVHEPIMRTARALTLDEALNGSEEFGLPPMDLSTSSGYPWKLYVEPGKPGKLTFISGEVGERKLSALALDGYNRAWKALEEGVEPDFVFHCVLKDELRSKEKIAQEQTRVVQCGPLIHSIIMRQLFGAFIGLCQKNYQLIPSAVGMNVYSVEWDSMIRLARSFGPFGFGGDISKFEAHFGRQTRDSLSRVMGKLYLDNADFGKLRVNMINATTNPRLLVNRELFQKEMNPSGTVGTTAVFNYYLIESMLYAAWCIVCESHNRLELATPYGYRSKVFKKSFGDDHFVVPRAECDFFHFHSCKEALTSCGVAYTYADKTNENPPSLVPVEEIPFLGNTTVCRDGMFYAARPIKDIRESLAYGTREQPWELVVRLRMDDALRAMYPHGFYEFTCLRETLLEISEDASVSGLRIDWVTCDALYRKSLLGVIPNQCDDDPYYYVQDFPRFYQSLTVHSDKAVEERERCRRLVAVFGRTSDGVHYHLPGGLAEAFSVETQGITFSSIKAGGSVDYSSVTSDSGNTDVKGTLDKPNYGGDPFRVVRQDMPDLASLTNSHTCGVVLDADPGRQSMASTADFGTLHPEMDLSYVMGRFQWLNTFQWSTTTTEGTVLDAYPLVPNPLMATYGGSDGTTTVVTVQGYLSQLFAFWKCDFVYRLMVVGSKFHTGRLLMVNLTGRKATDAPTISEALGQYASVVDLTESSTTYEFEIPYRAFTEMLRVRGWDLTPLEANEPVWRQFSMGTFLVMVLNRLRAPDSVSAAVDVNLFFSLRNPKFDFSRSLEAVIGLSSDEWGSNTTVTYPVTPTLAITEEEKEDIVEPQMLQERAPDVEPRPVGVTLENSDAVKADERKAPNLPVSDVVAERQLDYQQVASRRVWYGTLDWATTRQFGQPLFLIEAPRGFIKTNAVSNVVRSFVFYRPEMEFTVQLQSQAFQQGLLYMGFIPLTTAADAPLVYGNRNSLLLCPHILLSAGGTRSATLRVPFVHNKKYLDPSDMDILGTLVVMPWNVLRVGAGGTGQDLSAPVSLYFAMPEAEFKVLDPVPSTTAELLAAQRRVAQLEAVMADVVIEPQMLQEEQSPSNLHVDGVVATVNQPLPTTVAAPASGLTTAGPRDSHITSLAELCKRQCLVKRDFTGDVALKVGEIFCPEYDSSEPRGGMIRYIARLYRVWKGTFICTFAGPKNGILGYCSDPQYPEQSFKETLVGPDIGRDIGVGLGPTTGYSLNGGVQQFKIPFQSQYHVLQVPRTPSDGLQPSASTGYIYGTNDVDSSGANNGAFLFVGGGDDFRLGYLYHVPMLTKASLSG
jgi:hypothetical protein